MSILIVIDEFYVITVWIFLNDEKKKQEVGD